MIEAYPLSWPVNWPRTEHREWSRFGVSLAVARDSLLRELAALGAIDVVISSNIELRRDGLPYANRQQPDDPGVAIYFTLNGRQQCLPVDRWKTVRDNLRAAGLTVAALRGLHRWGAQHMIDAAFAGFQALPAPTNAEFEPAWWHVLGVTRDATEEEIRTAARRLAKVHHPDVGGDPEKFIEVQSAWLEGLKGR